MKPSDSSLQKEDSRAAILRQKKDEYLARMDTSHINFGKIPTDRLLIIDALNRWSAGAFGEGGGVRVTWGGNDPTFSTEEEAKEILKRAYETPALIYPISNFSLGDGGENLQYSILNSEYRLCCHSDSSRASAVNVAEMKHVSNVEACHQLWLFSATEDCVSYLNDQLDSYGLEIEDEEYASVRRLISGHLYENFSVGQIWNAIWRSVRHAAALSKREYYNNAKAAKLIPKKIDKVLTIALQDDQFQSYDRVASLPVPAILMLFRQRFNVSDSMTGREVWNSLAADARHYKPEESEDEPEDDDLKEHDALSGALYFFEKFTHLDEIFISCFDLVNFEFESPEWDDTEWMGFLPFEGNAGYKFNGHLFFRKISELIGAKIPTEAEVAAHAAQLPDEFWVEERARKELVIDSLRIAGMEKNAARFMAWSLSFTPEPDELVAMVQGIPVPSGLVAVRIKSTNVSGAYVEHKEMFGTRKCRIDLPEGIFEPQGDYRQLLTSMLRGDDDSVAEILAYAVSNAIRCTDEVQRAYLWEKVANKLVKIAGERRAEYGEG